VSADGPGASLDVTAKTSAVVILSQLTGKRIGYVGDLNAGADGVSGTGGINVDNIAGPVVYGYTTTASPGAIAAIAGCVTSSGIGHGACAHVTLQGVSCKVAQEVMAEYRKTRGRITSHGILQKMFTVHGQKVICKAGSGVAACGVGRGQMAFSVKS
jgi:hypothetical protein